MKKIDDNIYALEAFLRSSDFLDSARLYDASTTSPPSKQDDYLLHRKMVSHINRAFAFELAIKILYELDTGSWPVHPTHVLPDLFCSLEKSTQKIVKDFYDQARNDLCELSRNIDVLKNVQFATFKKALQNNADTVRDFKYDFELKGKTAAFGGISSSRSFPSNLLPYIKERRKVMEIPE